MENLLELVFNNKTHPKTRSMGKVRLTKTLIYLPSRICIENGIYASDKYSIKFIEKETILLFRDNENGFQLNKNGGEQSRTCELLHKNVCETILKIYRGLGFDSDFILFQDKKTSKGIELRPIRM